ncbi:MAG TPA: hypothetical protein VK511_01590 [Gemmatimonadaceae bacterium]|nr:hypothetical protein [Gemmatimonadaceae bacterium]
MQTTSRRHLAVAAAALTLIVANACSSAAPQERTWLESEGTIYPRCEDVGVAKANTAASADSSIAPGDVRVSMINALTGQSIPSVQLVHNYAQLTPDSLTFTNLDGRVRVHYLQRSVVVIAVNSIGWLPDSVTVDTRSGNSVQFALRSLCSR